MEAEEEVKTAVKETENFRTQIRLAFDQAYYVELKRILFRSGISLNEFFSHVIQQLVTGDPKTHELLEGALKARTAREISDIVHTDDESLYNLIEERLSNKKE